MWHGCCLPVGSWMRSIVNKKVTNNLDIAVIYGCGWITSETGLVMVCVMVPKWQDQRAGGKPYRNISVW